MVSFMKIILIILYVPPNLNDVNAQFFSITPLQRDLF